MTHPPPLRASSGRTLLTEVLLVVGLLALSLALYVVAAGFFFAYIEVLR